MSASIARFGAVRRARPDRTALHAIRSRPAVASILGIQALALVLVEARHKPWFDEAQAWLLARDTNPLDLLVRHLRYEGSPGLWHLILMVPAKLGLPYASMGVLSIAAAVVGSAILLLRSPLPRLLGAMICFSFFIFYQYGIVARSYCLMAPLLYLIAAGWRRRMDHPVRLAVLLSLLANVSLHGTIIAICLAAIHLEEVRRQWPSLSPEGRRHQLKPAAVFGAVVITVVAELWPPHDLAGGGAWHVTPPWAIFGADRVIHQLAIVLPALAVLAISLWWFWLRRCLLLFALPAGGLMTLFLFRYFAPWHAGTIFVLWVFALWLSLDGEIEPREVPRWSRVQGRRPRSLALGAAVVGLAGQLVWTGMSIAYEVTNSYSASSDVAAYIKAHHLDDQRIDLMGKWGVAVLPYFSRNIFADYNGGRGPSYFPWTSRQPLPSFKSDILLDDPDLIVVAVKSSSGPSKLACLPGYHREQVFTGGIYWPGGVLESESFAVYQRSDANGDQWFWGTCGLL